MAKEKSSKRQGVLNNCPCGRKRIRFSDGTVRWMRPEDAAELEKKKRGKGKGKEKSEDKDKEKDEDKDKDEDTSKKKSFFTW